MKKNKRGALAIRDTFLAGRMGIRRKILLYLLVLAGFIISMVWLFQNALLFYIYRGPQFFRGGAAPVVVVQADGDAAEVAVPDDPGEGKDGEKRRVLRLDEVVGWL